MKQINIVTRALVNAIEFDGKIIKRICFDLEHINTGWDSFKNNYNLNRRSNYTADDIIEFFEQFGFYLIVWDDEPGGNKECVTVRGKKHYRYTAYVTDYAKSVQKKMVVDIPLDFKDQGIVVTVY